MMASQGDYMLILRSMWSEVFFVQFRLATGPGCRTSTRYRVAARELKLTDQDMTYSK